MSKEINTPKVIPPLCDIRNAPPSKESHLIMLTRTEDGHTLAVFYDSTKHEYRKMPVGNSDSAYSLSGYVVIIGCHDDGCPWVKSSHRIFDTAHMAEDADTTALMVREDDTHDLFVLYTDEGQNRAVRSNKITRVGTSIEDTSENKGQKTLGYIANARITDDYRLVFGKHIDPSKGFEVFRSLIKNSVGGDLCAMGALPIWSDLPPEGHYFIGEYVNDHGIDYLSFYGHGGIYNLVSLPGMVVPTSTEIVTAGDDMKVTKVERIAGTADDPSTA
jgi:hypothetical protein